MPYFETPVRTLSVLSTATGLRGPVTIEAGNNITLTQTWPNIKIDSTGGVGGSGSVGGSGVANKLAFWSNTSMLSGATGLHWDAANGRLGISLPTVPEYDLDVGGNFRVTADDFTKAYRFRTVGSALDLDFGGADLYISGYDDAGFTTDQKFFIRLNAQDAYADTGGNWIFHDNMFGSDNLSITQNSGVVVNDSGRDYDTRVEGDTDANLIFADASADRVGIGTATPVEKLTVNGRIAMSYTTGASNASGYGSVFVKPDNSLYYLNPLGTEYDLTLRGAIGGSGVANKIAFFTNASMVSGATGLHWDSVNRRLGIGTATPAEILHLNNTDYTTMRFDAGSAEGFFYSDGVSGFVVAGSRSATPFRLVYNSTQRVDFSATENVINDNGADIDTRIEGDTVTNLVFVDAGNDRVGLGTSTPATRLDVSGSIKTSAVTLSLSSNAATPNALSGNTFYISNATATTINLPSNAFDGAKLMYAMKNTGGNPILVSAASGYRFGSNITSLATVVASKTNYIGVMYNGVDARWDVISEVLGY